MSTTVLFAASMEVTRATTTSSGSPSGKSSFGIRTAAGMSAKRSSTLCRPIALSISTSSEGMRLALSQRWHLRIWPGQSRLRRRELIRRFQWDAVALEIPDESESRAGLEDRRGREADRVLVCLGRPHNFEFRYNEGEQRAMADHGRRGTIQGFGDFLEAPTSSDCRLCEGLLARRDEIQVPPGAPLERLVLRLRDAGFIGGSLLQARALPDPESEQIREQDRTFNAPAQRAREDDARTFRGPRPCQVRNLRLAEGRERGPIEIGRVDRSDDLPMPNEHECPTHPSQPPEATATTRTRSPSAKDSSTGIGRSRRTRRCASGARPRARRRSSPVECGPSSTDCSRRAGINSAPIRILRSSSRTILSVPSQFSRFGMLIRVAVLPRGGCPGRLVR